MESSARESAASEPSAGNSGFASLLAALARPAPRTAAWDDEALADDVATLSYEQALRTHSRHRVPEGNLDFGPMPGRDLTVLPVKAEKSKRAAADEAKRAASITIRMSKTDSDRLHERAHDAGLTVSAYMRSCVFEAEALRAQVKEALAQIRAETASEEAAIPQQKRTWRARLFGR